MVYICTMDRASDVEENCDNYHSKLVINDDTEGNSSVQLKSSPGCESHPDIWAGEATAKNSSPGGRAAFPASLPIPWLALLKKIP